MDWIPEGGGAYTPYPALHEAAPHPASPKVAESYQFLSWHQFGSK